MFAGRCGCDDEDKVVLNLIKESATKASEILNDVF
jgi:hypothetical protein